MFTWKTTASILFLSMFAYFFLTFSRCCPISWLDIVLHFLGGTGAALLCVMIFKSKIDGKREGPSFYFFLIISGAILIGVAWELFEWILEHYRLLPVANPSLNDTMSDLAMDLLGSITITILFLKKVYNKSK